MSTDSIKLMLPSKPAYISVVRLTASSIANQMGFDIESIEDIRVSVSEACNLFIQSYREMEVEYKLLDNTMEMIVSGHDPIQPSEEIEENEYGILILESLMDEVSRQEDGIHLSKEIRK